MQSQADYSQGNRFPMFGQLSQRLGKEYVNRLQKYRDYWDAFDGFHWRNAKKEDGTTQNTFNYCKKFVEKGSQFLIGKGVKFNLETVDADYKSISKTNADNNKFKDEERNGTDFINYVWTIKNNKQAILDEMSKNGGVTGDCYVQVVWVDEAPNGDKLPKKKQYTKIIIIPSEYCHPEYDVIDKTMMVMFRFVYPKLVPRTFGEDRVVVYEEIHTAKESIIKEDGKIIKNGKLENKYGIIPFVHIPNIRVPGESFGEGDLCGIWELNHEFNRKMSELSDIISYSIAPITIIKGAKAGNITKGARKIWSGLPTDADVFNLTLNTDFGALVNYVNAVKKTMLELGDIPVDAFGSRESLSNVTGIALQLMYEPLLEKTRNKYITYGEGLEKVNNIILTVYDKEGALPKELKGKEFRTNAVFQNPLPKDRTVLLDELAKEVALEVESKAGSLKRLGSDNVEDKLREIDAEKVKGMTQKKAEATELGVKPIELLTGKTDNPVANETDKQNKANKNSQ